ncbi:hypothetical protein CEXT_750451 [Caerostris extrusa]|uniref:Uncharacterized protein n=1 Tax=Caerostris extrusa TaxID=172846 RepID=A0AAV4TP31_CAEEX|nr:hypothetical protein CEXT_750451 [Caerostris extrusa]
MSFAVVSSDVCSRSSTPRNDHQLVGSSSEPPTSVSSLPHPPATLACRQRHPRPLRHLLAHAVPRFIQERLKFENNLCLHHSTHTVLKFKHHNLSSVKPKREAFECYSNKDPIPTRLKQLAANFGRHKLELRNDEQRFGGKALYLEKKMVNNEQTERMLSMLKMIRWLIFSLPIEIASSQICHVSADSQAKTMGF